VAEAPDSAMLEMAWVPRPAAQSKQCSQLRGKRENTNQLFSGSSSPFSTTCVQRKQTTSDNALSEVVTVIGNRSISRVLSGYLRSPDDHFSTSMVTHAL
jgi:hypothetical protein